ncbi:MAG TPA: carboxypeptidase-like regulatory domain-containing protein [Candidatus Acidoferrum sp.]|nr:carboxypeptidase-like regulatory domain-containing protein [Candidatus Acidoferrum sp.]
MKSLPALLLLLSVSLASAQTPDQKFSASGKVVQLPSSQPIRKVHVTFFPIASPGSTGTHRTQSGTFAVGVILSADPPGRLEAFTDDAGKFTVENLSAGTYVVSLERQGFVQDKKAHKENRLTFRSEQDAKDLIFHMLTAGVISGKVFDTDGEPLRDAGVFASPASSGMSPAQQFRGTTNDLGEYRLPDLPPGKYIVEASVPGRTPLSSQADKSATKEHLIYGMTYFPGTLDRSQAAPIDVPAGGTAAANLTMLTTRAFKLRGNVAGLGQFVGAQLMLAGTGSQNLSTQIGPDGRFSFDNVLPGSYLANLIIFPGFGNSAMPRMHSIATPIEITDSDVTDLQLQVDMSGSVSGKFSMDGDEKADWRELSVALMPLAEGEGMEMLMLAQSAAARVNEDGTFELSNVPAVPVQIAVGAASDKYRNYYTKSVLLGGRDVVDSGFTATAGSVLDVVVSSKGCSVEGNVVDGEGNPFPGAFVISIPTDGKRMRPDAYQLSQSDPSGHFSLKGMNPGNFTILAFEEMPGNYRSASFAQKFADKGEQVSLAESANKSVNLKLQPEP